MNTLTCTLITALAFAAGSSLTLAGPLAPAAGPVQSTMKTLAEVEPRVAINAANTPGDNDASPSLYKITQPGSYYLTGNITGVVGKHGIEITASHVTLDLSGFNVAGVAGSKTGIFCNNNPNNIELRNGTVSLWGEDGVTLGGSHCRTIDIRAINNVGDGISLGPYSNARGCLGQSNGGVGVGIYSIGQATDCIGRFNGSHGISASNSGNTITNCVGALNAGNGIDGGQGNTITGCNVSGNTLKGIVTDASIVTNCSAAGNGSIGIEVGSFSTVTNCVANFNSLYGFYITDGSMLTNCSASKNGNNLAGRAGFVLNGVGGRAVGCHATQNVVGFAVSGTNNYLASNTATGNTSAQFTVTAGNDSGAVITNPGVGFATTNPAANVAP